MLTGDYAGLVQPGRERDVSDMGCVCDYDGDGEPCEFVVSAYVVSRKVHVCGECGESFPRGTKHEILKGKWEGEFFTHRTCPPCERIRNDLCSCAPIGLVRDAVIDNFGFDYVTGDDVPGWVAP